MHSEIPLCQKSLQKRCGAAALRENMSIASTYQTQEAHMQSDTPFKDLPMLPPRQKVESPAELFYEPQSQTVRYSCICGE